MAYNDAGDVKLSRHCPVLGEPGILQLYIANTSDEKNYLMDIPWKNCRLASAYTTCVTAFDSCGAMELDIELNAAAGTEMMTLQVSAGTSIGVQDYATVSSAAACNALDRDDASRDKINIEVDGSASAVGAVMLTMLFEPANND
jgi:hypothetical protein